MQLHHVAILQKCIRKLPQELATSSLGYWNRSVGHLVRQLLASKAFDFLARRVGCLFVLHHVGGQPIVVLEARVLLPYPYTLLDQLHAL